VCLFLIAVTPARDHTLEENRKAVDELVTKLQTKPVDAETMNRVKNMLRARFARMLGSNEQIAALLPSFYVEFGDWRRLFTIFTQYDRLTPEELQRVASEYLVPSGRTIAYIAPAPEPAISTTVGGAQ
jgi:zinc protease